MLKNVIIWIIKTIFSAFVEEVHRRKEEEEEYEKNSIERESK